MPWPALATSRWGLGGDVQYTSDNTLFFRWGAATEQTNAAAYVALAASASFPRFPFCRSSTVSSGGGTNQGSFPR